jgi:hypothetical protein
MIGNRSISFTHLTMINSTSITNKLIILVGLAVVVPSLFLFLIPPALFPDPSIGFQVLRCMHLGGGFNNIVAPDQDDISQTYTEFLTWWSPGQYLVPYFFKFITGLNLGQAIAATVVVAKLLGLAGFFQFFKKIGFTPLISALSLVFIICQEAFVVPYVYYSGGEVLLFAFEGWFLYGCASLTGPGFKLFMFVLISGWIGFFLKSSFVWIYAAGLFFLWIRLSPAGDWLKKGIWIGVPAVVSMTCIYAFFLSKGQSPASAAHGIKLTLETFGFPLASPLLSDFSIDDILHGMLFHTGKPILTESWSLVLMVLLAIGSLILVFNILRKSPNKNYRMMVPVFYVIASLFFGLSYLFQANISYEARHFRVLGLLMVPGIIYLVSSSKLTYKVLFALIFAGLAYNSFNYMIKGLTLNSHCARGETGIAQVNIDQQSLNQIMKLDRETKNATFVFIGNDLGLEIMHNHLINMLPVADDLKINMDDYTYKGFAGPLFIVLPETYNGPKEKLIMKSFPNYAGWNVSMLSDNYVLYTAARKK